jgi:DmsE family decaheme c-type cytochrome
MKNGKGLVAAAAKVLVAAFILVVTGTAAPPALAQEPEKPQPAAQSPQPPAPELQPAAQPAPPKDLVLRGDATCTLCHNTPEILSIGQARHGVTGDARTPSCQTCHGESTGHMTNPAGAPPDVVFKKGPFEASDDRVRAGQCLACHRGTARTRWDGSPHQNNQLGCNDCHRVHVSADPVLARRTQIDVCFACHKEPRADSHKISTHPIQVGKVVCSDCHNPHGSAGPALVKKNTINETCWTCHADKRGPFLFEHQPVVENCAYCHTPHGSNITPLLSSRPPWLCQSCHDGQHSSENAIGRNAAGNQAGLTNQNPSNQALGRACLNCHSVIHGSNSPSGGYLQR